MRALVHPRWRTLRAQLHGSTGPKTFRRGLRTVCAALLLSFVKLSWGQLGVSLTAETDYRYRGISLSKKKPALRLSLAYDDASGWYAGAAATQVELNQRQYLVLAYLGYARRWAPGLSWEIGATSARFTENSGYRDLTGYDYDFSEAYAGLIADRWNCRVYYSPDYYAWREQTAYVELNGGRPLRGTFRLVGHLGALLNLGQQVAAGARRVRYDLRLGVARSTDRWDMQLAWSGASREHVPRFAPTPSRSGWVLSASRFF